jgi:AcrR family transcriptional regulator
MPRKSRPPATRPPLSRDRVLEAAISLADREGVEALTMRRLGKELGVEAMSLYNHVANKDDILAGMVDLVFAEIALPPSDTDWRAALRQRCVSARQVLRGHPWAVPLMESGTSPGPATLRHHDAVLGCLFDAGLPTDVVAHAYAIVDAFVYGFATQEASLPAAGAPTEEFAQIAAQLAASMPADEFPHLARFTSEYVLQPGYDFGDSFDVGLDLVLDGIERLVA